MAAPAQPRGQIRGLPSSRWLFERAYSFDQISGVNDASSQFEQLSSDRCRIRGGGPFHTALPILYLDRLVGKLDASVDRTSGVLTVHAIHEDVPFSNRMNAGVRREIAELATWLEVDAVWAG